MAVGVKASASLVSMELIMSAIFDGSCTKEYILELVAQETSGKSRAEKVNRTLRRVTVNNPILPFVLEHKDEFTADLRNKNSRPVVMTALMCAAYPIIYDTMSMLGKYFHAQDEVSMNLISTKLSESYGASVDFSVAYNSTIKMLIEAGMVERPRVGFYTPCRIDKASEFALAMYKKAFLLNNPNYSASDDVESNPFFEFIK